MSVMDPMAELSGVRVFVVEDHAFQRTGLVSLLRTIGIQQIREASNGREALAALEADGQPPDVILCDLEMPEMDGIEFLRAVAERKLARGIIIISGRELEILSSVEVMLRASGLAVLGNFKKPASPEVLRRLLSRGAVVAPSVARNPEPAVDAAEVRRGIGAREFHCEFQPKVRLDTGELVGVEALARWLPRDSVPVSPNLFVPALVRAGLIAALTEQMIDAACIALKAWSVQGLTLNASVNVSMSTLADLGVADRFLAQVHAHGLDPQRITFEVTETEVMADVAAVLNVMARLRLKGFSLAIDDFGTGYSSLAQLNAIPFTELKIDQTFVRNCERSQRLRNIIQSTIELAQRLGVRTVAEGIESEKEWNFLRYASCDEGQGYHVARPMPAAEIPAWAARWLGRASAEV